MPSQTPFEAAFPAAPASVRQVRDAVARIATMLGASRQVIEDIRLCVSEAATNVIRHAYSGPKGELRVQVERAGPELTVSVSDDGVGLDAFQREGELGHGLRIIERLALRASITSAPHAGTEVRMVFPLDDAPRQRSGTRHDESRV